MSTSMPDPAPSVEELDRPWGRVRIEGPPALANAAADALRKARGLKIDHVSRPVAGPGGDITIWIEMSAR